MKCRTSQIIVALVISLLTGCSKSGSNVQVLSAVYGSGANFADVSDQVSDLIHLKSGFNANPNWLKADPTPGWNKVLVIVYQVKGRRHIFTTGEGGSVSATILLETAKQ